MLHILLLILKIAGIILAVILGILILLVCIVLFVPVRYELTGRAEGNLASLKGKILITWFLRLVRMDVYYKEQKLKWRIRIAWIKKTGGQKKEESGNEENHSGEEEPERITERAEKSEESREDEKAEADEAIEAAEETEKPGADREPEEGKESEESKEPEECEEAKESGEKSKESMEETAEAESGHEETSAPDKEPQEIPEKRTGIFEKIQRAVKNFIEKIKGIFRKIRDTFRNIRSKIAALCEKKNKILDFIRDETHVGAFHKGKKEVFKLLRRLNPRKLLIEARFGFEDPSVTGKVLAVLGVLYPFLGDHMEVTPDFERQVLKGRVYIKGKVCGYYFLILCWNLFWSRHVRQTYKDIKNFEF